VPSQPETRLKSVENHCLVAPRKKRQGVTSPVRRAECESILSALGGLDCLLASALASARESSTEEDAPDGQFRGLYLTHEGVARLLTREPGAPAFSPDEKGEADPAAQSHSFVPLLRLADDYGLSPFDLNVLLIALAPELDRRYEQVYAYLQDDVTRKRPTVDLALNLLCRDAGEKLARRVHFAPGSPLVRAGLLHLIPEVEQQPTSLLAHALKLDEQLISFLTGQQSLDARLTPFSQLAEPSGQGVHPFPGGDAVSAILRLARAARAAGERLSFYFQGPEGTGRRHAAEALARDAGVRLLVVDVPLLLAGAGDCAGLLRLALNGARFAEAIPYFEGIDTLVRDENAVAYRSLLEALGEFEGLCVLSGERSLSAESHAALNVVTVPFARPDFEARRALWAVCLAGESVRLGESDLDALAGRLRLSRGQISGAVRDARMRARLRDAPSASSAAGRPGPQPTARELFAAARAQARHELASLTSKIEPKYVWDDIQLPADQLEQLREICAQAERQHVVYGEWGFGRKTSAGRGVVALFSGPPGTGKTMAAEVVAGELGLDLFKIDLSQIVSKYIGETEKNLDRIFREARSSNAVLFFDEADALFGKRSEVKDAHDRYANIEVGYLLQKVEMFDGIALLATNLRQNMDEAFVRRMGFIVEFPFPDEEYRRRIWESVFPSETPLGGDVDFGALARTVRLSGGHIKNIALAAAFYAAADGRVVSTAHLMRAARREYQKLGRKLNDAERPGESGAAAEA
jgi:AAA+ superfamily predicted ATPase